MASIEDQTNDVLSLIAGLSSTDPRIYDAITRLANQLQDVTQVLNPVAKIVIETKVAALNLIPPENPRFQILNQAIRLEWDRPPSGASFTFEIRQGSNWDTAIFVARTQSTIADLVPIAGGGQTYLLKSIDTAGNYSIGTTSVTISSISPEPVSISGQVIDNNVLLKWTDSISSLAIDYYEISKGSVVVGNVKGNFATFFEILQGQYIYTVVPVDVVGTRGTGTSITLLVSQPPDYVLTDSRTSLFAGAKTSLIVVK